MANYSIHLAIGKLYNELHPVKDFDLFIEGIMAPDIKNDKYKMHYTKKTNSKNTLEILENKCRLYPFLQENKLDNEYNLGIFIHLITDYLFYNDFLDKNKIINKTYEDYSKDLYYSYDLIKDKIDKEFNLESLSCYKRIKNKLENQNVINEKRNIMLNSNDVIKFIKRVSNIDVYDYALLIKDKKNNILPKY